MASSFQVMFFTVLFGVALAGSLSLEERGKDLRCHLIEAVCTLYLGPSRPKDKDYRLMDPRKERKKDGLGPVMVSDTLCPAVHILGT